MRFGGVSLLVQSVRQLGVPPTAACAVLTALVTPPRGLSPAVIELYTEWAGPTAAARSAWRKMATELGEPLPFDLGSVLPPPPPPPHHHTHTHAFCCAAGLAACSAN